MNYHTKTTVVCCNPVFRRSSSRMDHRTAFHIRVGLAQARLNNMYIRTYILVSHGQILYSCRALSIRDDKNPCEKALEQVHTSIVVMDVD